MIEQCQNDLREIKSREIQSLEICALNLRLQAKTKRFELREIELEIRDRIKLDGQDVIILNSDAKDFKKKIIEGGYN